MSKPHIILSRPQLGENIGAAARIMYNFGLQNLRLISPRDGWPNKKANTLSSGGGSVVDNAILYNNASPIFMDTDKYFNIDPDKTIEFIKKETYLVKLMIL